MTKKKAQISYTPIATSILWDKNISLTAKGLYAFICSCRPGWKSSAKGYASVLKEGVTAVRNAITELVDAGYIVRDCRRDKNGKYSEMKYHPTVLPFTETPCPDEPSSVLPLTEDLSSNTNSKETNLNEDNIKESNTKEYNTVSPSEDLFEFEKYLRRPLTPSELQIWNHWQEEKINPKAIVRAVEDNEFRKDKMTLHHVDETLLDWKERGISTLKGIDNYMLDCKLERTESFLRQKFEYDDEKYESEVAASKVAQTILIRDDLLNLYKTDGKMFLSYIGLCPTEVLRYLPDGALQVAIHYFEGTGNQERKEAALAALDEEVWS